MVRVTPGVRRPELFRTYTTHWLAAKVYPSRGKGLPWVIVDVGGFGKPN
jgi:hypothetical protein